MEDAMGDVMARKYPLECPTQRTASMCTFGESARKSFSLSAASLEKTFGDKEVPTGHMSWLLW